MSSYTVQRTVTMYSYKYFLFIVRLYAAGSAPGAAQLLLRGPGRGGAGGSREDLREAGPEPALQAVWGRVLRQAPRGLLQGTSTSTKCNKHNGKA